ncbi:hypothetical protein TWF281_003717 [Arthrobotrys megalospora]
MPYLPGILFDMEGNILENVIDQKTLDGEAKIPKPGTPSVGDTSAGYFTPASGNTSSKTPAAPKALAAQKAPTVPKVPVAPKATMAPKVPVAAHSTPRPAQPKKENNKQQNKPADSDKENQGSEDYIIIHSDQSSRDPRFARWENSVMLPNHTIKKIANDKIAPTIKMLFESGEKYPCKIYFRDLLRLFKSVPKDDRRVEELKLLLCKGYATYFSCEMREYIIPRMPRDDPDFVVMYSTLAVCLLHGRNVVKGVVGGKGGYLFDSD